MKKICCMLLVCMMIITGISIPAFAVDGHDREIRNLTEEQVTKLEDCVNSTFEALVKNEDFEGSEGDLFDAVCCGDLLSKYYRSFRRQNEMKECLAKVYAFKAELVWSGLANEANTLECFSLERYLLDKALDYVEEINKGLADEISNRGAVMNDKALIFAQLYGLIPNDEDDVDVRVDFLDRICENAPKSKEEYINLLNSLDDDFDDADTCDTCLNGSDLFSRHRGNNCVMKINEARVYNTGSVIKAILLGNFNFENIPSHIAFGAFMR